MGYWPLREMLLAYLDWARHELRLDLRHRQLLYQVCTAFGGAEGVDLPKIPKLLREKGK